MKAVFNNRLYYIVIVFIIFINCQNKREEHYDSKKAPIDSSYTKQYTTISSINNSNDLLKRKVYFLSLLDQKDTVYRYYPDAGISDSLAVIEGLKTKVFGIAISLNKKNLYIFFNDTLFFDEEDKINPLINIFKKDTLVPSLNKLIEQKKLSFFKYREGDIDFIKLIYKGDTIEYGYFKRPHYYKFVESIRITHPEIDIFTKFKIGICKKKFFEIWGFNDIPVNGNFKVHLYYTFDFLNYEGEKNLWFNKFLPKFLNGKDFNGGLEEVTYTLIFKNNKLIKILVG